MTSRSGSPSCADDPAGGVGLDDVAAVDALLDAVAQLADEDRRGDPATGVVRASTLEPGGGGSGAAGSGHAFGGCRRTLDARPRLLRWVARDHPLADGPGGADAPPRPCTSRSIRRSCTSWRSCATSGPSRRSSARSSASCRGCSATRRWRTSRVRPLEVRTPIEPMTAHELGERIGLVPDPAGRAGHGRRDARADADRPGLAPRACSATSGRCGRSSTTTSCRTRRPSTCA